LNRKTNTISIGVIEVVKIVKRIARFKINVVEDVFSSWSFKCKLAEGTTR